MIRHRSRSKGGTARLAFVVPANAAGDLLKVKVTIKAGRQSATKVATFRVQERPKPSLSIGDASAPEGNAGTTTPSFPVTLSAPSTQTVSVSYGTADGTATAGGDYTTASGTLTFSPGETAKTIIVAVVGDTAVEQDMSCSEVPIALTDLPFNLRAAPMPIGPNWSFGFDIPVSDSEGAAS